MSIEELLAKYGRVRVEICKLQIIKCLLLRHRCTSVSSPVYVVYALCIQERHFTTIITLAAGKRTSSVCYYESNLNLSFNMHNCGVTLLL